MQPESFTGNLFRLAWPAVLRFVATLTAMVLVGGFLAGASYYVLRHQPGWAWFAAALALVEAIGAGFVLAGKRALLPALAGALQKFRLGSTAVRLVFRHFPGFAPADDSGEGGGEGGIIARTAARIPLAQAEQGLRRATTAVTNAEAGGISGFFQSRLQRLLLRLVEKYTLARFREEGAVSGGIDLGKVRTELETSIDDQLAAKITSGLRLWTWVVVLALPLVVALQTYLLLRYLE